MAFTTICPTCDARLTAPDTVRGKKVKCKKCDEPFVARPADEPDDDRPAKPTRKRRIEDDEDEAAARRPPRGRRPVEYEDEPRARRRRDEDDDEPRPRSRKKGNKKKGSSALLTVLLIFGALVIAGGAVGAYYAFIKEDKPDTTGIAETSAPKGAAGPKGKGAGPMPGAAAGPITWVDYSAPDGTFTAKFPQTPVHSTPTVQTPNGPLPTDLYEAETAQVKVLVLSAALPGIRIGDPIPQEVIDQALEQACNAMAKQLQGAREVSRKSIMQDGRPGREMVIAAPDGSGGTARVFIANARIWNLLFAFKHAKPDEATINTFFDSFELK